MTSIPRRFAAALPALAALLLPLLLAACGGNYGVGAKTPLGTKAAYDDALRAKVIETQEIPATELKRHLGPHKELNFAVVQGLAATKYDKGGEYILAIHDTGGTIRGVVGNFRSGARAFSTVGGTIDAFASKLWLAARGGEPQFKEVFLDGATDDQYLIAEVGDPRNGSYWRKDAHAGNLSLINTMYDMVVLWKP